MVTYGIAQGQAWVNIYIPPGSQCPLSWLTWGGFEGANSIANNRVWAYGATLNTVSGYIVGRGLFDAAGHDAFIQSANAGDATVTLVTAGDAVTFSAGDWIGIYGLTLQTFGFPPNFQFYEYRVITAITGTTTKVITLSSPLTNTYLSTWPSFAPDAIGFTGPAKIFKMQPGWNSNSTLMGATITSSIFTGSQDQLVGRDVQVYDTVFQSENVTISMNKNAWMFGCAVNGQEVDKNIEFVGWSRHSVQSNLTFLSPSPRNAIIENSRIAKALNGTPVNSTFNNVIVGTATIIGTTNYGHGDSVVFNNSVLPSPGALANHTMPASAFTYNGTGRFSILKSASGNAVAWGVPGKKYAFADSDGTLNSSPPTSFTITSVTEDGTNVFFQTDIPGALPTPICNASPCPNYVAYPAATITQRFSGPANLTQFAAP